MPPALTSARRNYRLSALIARRAVREAGAARGFAAVSAVVAAHQIANAVTSQVAVDEMLAEQGMAAQPDGLIAPGGFATERSTLATMLAAARDAAAVALVVDSLVQDAGRAAESVSIASRNVSHVRQVTTPCCARCAVLAGRVYRWSDGFQRHPRCDCSMIPTTSSRLRQDPDELVRSGQVRGLSRADQEALGQGADLGQVVNVRSKSAGLMEAGHALTRSGRPTPAGIYRVSSDRTEALALLQRHGYLR